MRIGLDGIPLASAKTGIGHYTFELSQALAKIDPEDEFELISPVPFFFPLESNAPNLQKIEAARRRSWWILGLPLYIRRHSLALFHGTNYEIPLWHQCPTVLTIHDLSLLVHPQTHESHLVRRARYRLPIMARSATRIITATEFIKKEISEHLGVNSARIAVTPYAPRGGFHPPAQQDIKETKDRLGVEELFLLFVGTIEPRKNLITLLRAFAEILRNSDLRPQLVIAGPRGWLMNETTNYIRKEGLTGRVKFTGYVSDYDLRSLYASCAAFVYPSLYEGFGLPPLEAMACGAPVIAADVPSLTETTEKAAVTVPPRDVQTLARELVEMISNKQKQSYYSKVGLEHASQFSWERTAKLTLDVYKSVKRKP